MPSQHFAAIGMGSNLNDPLANMNRAAALLQQLPHCSNWRFSSLYHSEAVDCPEPFPFLNAAACCETNLEPDALLARLLELENSFGRQRPYANAPRPLDLDLLLFDDQISNRPELTLPHPRMHERLFVLEPLAELCPKQRHPSKNGSMEELLEQCRESVHGAYGVQKSHKPWPDVLF